MKIISYITEYLNKCIGNGKSKDYVKHILSAASHGTYVEAISNKADSLHLKIKNSYEEDIKAAYMKAIKNLIKFKRFGAVTLAIDLTHEVFYGKTRDFYIFHCGDEVSCEAEFHYIVISIVDAGKNIPLMSLPVTLGCNRADLVEELILFVKSILRINLILFDRGLASAELINSLNKLKVRYLMFSRRTLAIKRLLNPVEDFEIITNYELKYYKEGSKIKVKTNLVLIKARNEDDCDWIFYTNLHRKDARDFIAIYNRRWQIETNFRVEDEARIKSKSANYLIRYFYFMISLLLHALWIIFPTRQFKWFVIKAYEYLFLKDLGIEYTFSV